jgi:hypothetical protein
MRGIFVLGALSLALCAVTSTASAGGNHVGVRGGVTDDPESVFFGLHLLAGPHGRGLRIEPSLELGFGDDFDFFTVRANGNFKYAIPIGQRRGGAYLYPLFGPSLYYFNLDDCSGDRCDDTEIGINVGMGLEISALFFDIAAGIGDIPELTFTFGVGL